MSCTCRSLEELMEGIDGTELLDESISRRLSTQKTTPQAPSHSINLYCRYGFDLL